MSLPSVLVGIIVGVGGVFGYVKSGSIISLAMGLLSAAIFLWSASIMPTSFGYHLSIAYGCFLGLLMGSRYLNSGKFMPAGLVATISLSLALYNTFLLYNYL